MTGCFICKVDSLWHDVGGALDSQPHQAPHARAPVAFPCTSGSPLLVLGATLQTAIFWWTRSIGSSRSYLCGWPEGRTRRTTPHQWTDRRGHSPRLSKGIRVGAQETTDSRCRKPLYWAKPCFRPAGDKECGEGGGDLARSRTRTFRGGGKAEVRVGQSHGGSSLCLREKRVHEVAAAGAAVFHLGRGRLRGA